MLEEKLQVEPAINDLNFTSKSISLTISANSLSFPFLHINSRPIYTYSCIHTHTHTKNNRASQLANSQWVAPPPFQVNPRVNLDPLELYPFLFQFDRLELSCGSVNSIDFFDFWAERNWIDRVCGVDLIRLGFGGSLFASKFWCFCGFFICFIRLIEWGDCLLADRSSGRLVGPNGENGGASDAKNLRVKVFQRLDLWIHALLFQVESY